MNSGLTSNRARSHIKYETRIVRGGSLAKYVLPVVALERAKTISAKYSYQPNPISASLLSTYERTSFVKLTT